MTNHTHESQEPEFYGEMDLAELAAFHDAMVRGAQSGRDLAARTEAAGINDVDAHIAAMSAALDELLDDES
jgi:hypothetical protein